MDTPKCENGIDHRILRGISWEWMYIFVFSFPNEKCWKSIIPFYWLVQNGIFLLLDYCNPQDVYIYISIHRVVESPNESSTNHHSRTISQLYLHVLVVKTVQTPIFMTVKSSTSSINQGFKNRLIYHVQQDYSNRNLRRYHVNGLCFMFPLKKMGFSADFPWFSLKSTSELGVAACRPVRAAPSGILRGSLAGWETCDAPPRSLARLAEVRPGSLRPGGNQGKIMAPWPHEEWKHVFRNVFFLLRKFDENRMIMSLLAHANHNSWLSNAWCRLSISRW